MLPRTEVERVDESARWPLGSAWPRRTVDSVTRLQLRYARRWRRAHRLHGRVSSRSHRKPPMHVRRDRLVAGPFPWSDGDRVAASRSLDRPRHMPGKGYVGGANLRGMVEPRLWHPRTHRRVGECDVARPRGRPPVPGSSPEAETSSFRRLPRACRWVASRFRHRNCGARLKPPNTDPGVATTV